MKTYGRVEVQLHVFSASALGGGELSASRPGRFTPGERAPNIHWIGGWMGPGIGLDAVMKRKNLCPCWGSNPGHPICSSITILTELPWLTEVVVGNWSKRKSYTSSEIRVLCAHVKSLLKSWQDINHKALIKLRPTWSKREVIRGCLQKFPDWPLGARTANGTALCH
jgi:hypothetical protein